MLDGALSLLAGVALGLSLAAPPGPMNAIIAEESVLRGWSSGFRAGLGAMSADACFFVLALAGVVTVVRDAPIVRGALFGLGGLLMLYFAYGAATDADEAFGGRADGEATGGGATDGEATDGGATDGEAVDSERSESEGTESGAVDSEDAESFAGAESKGFRKAFVLALTNPYQILWWLTAGVSLLDPGTFTIDALGGIAISTGSPIIVAGFFAGIAVWISGFPAALVTIGRRVDAFAPIVAGLSAAVLAVAGLSFLSEAVGVLT